MVSDAEPTSPPAAAATRLLADLAASLPDDIVLTDPDLVENYRWDWSRDPDAGRPLAVIRPRDAQQVQQTVRWAAEHRVPIVPRGTGTGISGGASAVEGGLVVGLDRMQAIEIDRAARMAVVEPGALNIDVKLAAAAQGLWYPPDPGSVEISSIGGNVATNAGGLCCVKYGVTTDYVLGLDVVLADGTLITVGGPRIKDVAGLPLTKLFVGSEGTLGIITRVILRLLPPQPPPSTVVASFPTIRAAAEAVVEAGESMRASMMELLDQATVNAIEDHTPMGLDRNAAALLIAQTDAPGPARAAERELLEQVFSARGATEVFATDDPREGELFTASRRAAFPAVERLGQLLLEDVGIAVPLLPALFDGIGVIAQRHNILITTIAHAGDGNVHPSVVYDATDADSTARARAAFDDIMALTIALDGTITGEHGIGRLKRSYLPDQLGPEVMAVTRRIKDAFDPEGLFNPGAGY